MAEEKPPQQQGSYPYPQGQGAPMAPAYSQPQQMGMPMAPAYSGYPAVYQQPAVPMMPAPYPAPMPMAAGGAPPAGYPGYRSKPPRIPPQPGQVIVAWEFEDPVVGCCVCESLSMMGWIAVVLLVCFSFGLFAPIVCCIPACHDKSQRPVYGYPGQAPGTVPQNGQTNGANMQPAGSAAPGAYIQGAPPMATP